MKLPFKPYPTQDFFIKFLLIFYFFGSSLDFLNAQTSNIDSTLIDEVLGEPTINLEFHESNNWKVESESNEAGTIYHGSNHSVINWNKLDAESFLDINSWKTERIKKDRFPLWKEIYRAKDHQELVGKIINCYGDCRIYRGAKFSFAQHMSQVLELDEIHVMKNSSALLLLNDASLVRISANTQLMINEMNVTKEKYFYYFTLVYGHIYWEQRYWGKYQVSEKFETDSAFRPLLPIQNNFSFFQKNIYQQKNFAEKRALDIDPLFGLSDFIDQINIQHQKNNEQMQIRRESEVLLVAANYNLFTKNAHFHAFSAPNREGHFRVFQQDKNNHLISENLPTYSGKAYFRGYANHDEQEIKLDTDYQVDSFGRKLKELSENMFLPVTYLSSRSYSIWHYRENEYFKLFPYAAQSNWKAKELGENFGLRIWNLARPNELEIRQSFIKEHSRRHMTTFLKHRDNLPMENDFKIFSIEHYQAAVDQYFRELKSRFSMSKQFAKEASDLEFYIFVLKQNKRKKILK